MSEVEAPNLIIQLVAAQPKVQQPDIEKTLSRNPSSERFLQIDRWNIHKVRVNKRQLFRFDQVRVLQPALVHDCLIQISPKYSQLFVLFQQWHRVVTAPERPIKHL